MTGFEPLESIINKNNLQYEENQEWFYCDIKILTTIHYWEIILEKDIGKNHTYWYKCKLCGKRFYSEINKVFL